MSNPLKRSHRLNALKVKDLVVAEAMTQEKLARKAGISTTTLSKTMNGHPASMDTIRRIAKALNVEDVQSLIGSEAKAESNANNPDVEIFIGRSDDEEGILASVRRAARNKKPLVMYLSPGILALLCCLSGLAPIDARNFFIAGMVFSAIGIALAYPRKLLIALPMTAMAINLIAYVAWPQALGFFPVKGVYIFGFGERRPGWSDNQKPRIHAASFHNGTLPKINERVTIFDGNKLLFGMPYDGQYWRLTVGLEPGMHNITVHYGTRSFSRRILVDLKGNFSGETTFDFEQYPIAGDATTNVSVNYEKDHVSVQPANTKLILDGNVITLDGETGSFQTTSGWHTLTLQISGKEVSTKQYFANPRIEQKFIGSEFDMSNVNRWNIVLFDLN